MKKLSALLLFAFILVAGCQPSETAIQTAVAQTQAAYTPTLQPTATANPCTDKGWMDIETYLKTFDSMYMPKEGTSIAAYLDGLENMKNKINSVEIDACSEHARQTIVSSCANRIYAMTLVLTKTDVNNEATYMVVDSLLSLEEARTELMKLGIKLDLPQS